MKEDKRNYNLKVIKIPDNRNLICILHVVKKLIEHENKKTFKKRTYRT